MAPTVSQLVCQGLLEPKAVPQLKSYQAGVTFARSEGIIPAPETCHALACVIDEANKAKAEGKEKVILFNFSGHGLLDLTGYDKYFAGELTDIALTDQEMAASEAVFAGFPKPQLIKG